jgi:hypothetical protein
VKLFFLDWLAGYLAEQGVEDAEIWKSLQEQRCFVRVRVHIQRREWRQIPKGMLSLLLYHPQELAARIFSKVRSLLGKVQAKDSTVPGTEV